MIKLLLIIISVLSLCFAFNSNPGNNNKQEHISPSIVPVAVNSNWRLLVNPVDGYQEPFQHQIIEVPPFKMPIKILYHTTSSELMAQQIHHPGEHGETETTRSYEKPYKLSHEIIRPVIQELHEVIIPFRRIVQKISPVFEEKSTIMASKEGHQNIPLSQSHGNHLNISKNKKRGEERSSSVARGHLSSIYGNDVNVVYLKDNVWGGHGPNNKLSHTSPIISKT